MYSITAAAAAAQKAHSAKWMKRITLAWKSERKIVRCAPMLLLPLLLFFAFLLIFYQIYPRSYLFAIALMRIHCCFFFPSIPSFRWFSCMLSEFTCHTATVFQLLSSTQHKLIAIALIEPVQSKYTLALFLIQQRIYSYFILYIW